MVKNTRYPPPGRPQRTPRTEPTREIETWDQYEERLFRNVDYFNVVRFGHYEGGEVCTVKTFPEALYIAHENPRSLIYVVTAAGHAFCMDRKDREKYGRIWLEIFKPGAAANEAKSE